MSSLDSLPGDQRAVLELVLGRGRSYDEIARLLSIKPSAVRERAQIALDAIGPHTDLALEQQQQIADYLLGQLPEGEAARVRDLLADSPAGRAWARAVSSELTNVASDRPMPAIPAEPERSEPVAAPPRTVAASGATPVGGPRSSRLGGALVILAVLIAAGAGLFFVLRGGHSNTSAASATTTASTSTPAAGVATSATASTTSSTATSAKVVAQINLTPPTSDRHSNAAGIAEVLNEGTTDGVAIVAQNVPPNSTKPPNAYAVWLYNSPTDAKILGFVNPGVGKTGRLSTAGTLPSNASHYKHLVVTVETTASPKAPGAVILQGSLTNL
ncbi:MAG: RNA polymerase sigma factor [Solirubrobacteraceae bacterium]